MTLVEVVIALGISVVTVAGIVTGYIYCTTANVKESLYQAANGHAAARLEEVRSARWDTSSFPPVDELVATNFLGKNVVLDLSGSRATTTPATIHTEISDLSVTPPVRRIRVQCIWSVKGDELVTNTIETCRAPDQ
jgi:type II secretory pathway pseudopilin PulG